MTPAPTGRVVVIGVGNPWRRDDGAGPAVVTAVLARLGDEDRDIAVLVLDGEAARLVEAWDGARLAVVVDAVRTGAAPGTVHRFDVTGHGDDGAADPASIPAERAGSMAGAARPAGPTRRGSSSHGLGVAQAVELAQALDRMPRRLVVIGVEGADFRAGTDLSAPVAAAVEPAAGLIAGLIGLAAGHVAKAPTTRAPRPMSTVAAGRLVIGPNKEQGRCA